MIFCVLWCEYSLELRTGWGTFVKRSSCLGSAFAMFTKRSESRTVRFFLWTVSIRQLDHSRDSGNQLCSWKNLWDSDSRLVAFASVILVINNWFCAIVLKATKLEIKVELKSDGFSIKNKENQRKSPRGGREPGPPRRTLLGLSYIPPPGQVGHPKFSVGWLILAQACNSKLNL